MFTLKVRLLIKTASASQKTILSGIKFLGEVTKSLKAEESSEKTQNLEEPRQNGGGIAQMLGVASIAEENDLPCTMTSGDIASMDTTFSRDTDLQEYPTDGVKLSLWLQWTLPNASLRCTWQANKVF
ncbi:hypothetical protein DPMN_117485 [Dreissena polymorpha]|uniref:Uncharacterized protein n=1 Tax=Dreissena polymorpha TaxID=45954 RepID=A0A9D4KPZ1_DREPO|nr:hypothetical protein DPMN_117485 [Dreissena polymorpha]